MEQLINDLPRAARILDTHLQRKVARFREKQPFVGEQTENDKLGEKRSAKERRAASERATDVGWERGRVPFPSFQLDTTY